MNRFQRMLQRVSNDRDAEASALARRAKVVAISERTYGSSRLPASAGPLAMRDRSHPEAHVAWADGPVSSPSRGEMGGSAYPQERGGAPRELSRPHDASPTPDDTRIVHPVWGPRAPSTLSPGVIEMARRLMVAIRVYQKVA